MCLLSEWLCQDEAEYVLPSYQLSETHWSGWWMKASYLLWEANDHRDSCWIQVRSGSAPGSGSVVGTTNKCSHEARCLIPQQSALGWNKGHCCGRTGEMMPTFICSCMCVVVILCLCFTKWSLPEDQSPEIATPVAIEVRKWWYTPLIPGFGRQR